MTRSGTLKARAFLDGAAPSAVQAAAYQVNGWIGAGALHTLGLKTDGTLWAWGAQLDGRLGNGASATASVALPGPVKKAAAYGGGFLTGIIDAAGGENHSLAADRDGAVWAFGQNGSRQLGNGGATDSAFATRVFKAAGSELSGIDTVKVGYSFGLAPEAAGGKVWAWGLQTYGRCGTGVSTGTAAYATAVKVDASIDPAKPALANIAQLAAGQYFALAAEPKTTDGTGRLWAWGHNTNGQVGDGTVTQRNGAVWVRKTAGGAPFDNVAAVAAGDLHGAAVVRSASEAGTVWCWGAQANGRLGNGQTAALDVKLPVRVELPSGLPLTGIIAVAAGAKHTLALDEQGRVWSWGSNTVSQLGRTPVAGTAPAERPALVTAFPAGTRLVEIAAGNDSSFAVASTGLVYGWGANTNGRLGQGDTVTPHTTPAPAREYDPLLLAPYTKNFVLAEDLDDPDRDGLPNWRERAVGTNILDPDSDDDGLLDGAEVLAHGTNPLSSDSDADTLGDAFEVNFGLDPWRNDADEDPDGDSRTNLAEMQAGSDPHDYYNAEAPLLIISGNQQAGLQGTVLSEALVVQVCRKLSNGTPGDPLPNAPVTFSAAGRGSIAGSSSGEGAQPALTVRSDSGGYARVWLVLPDLIGAVCSPTARAAGYTTKTFSLSTFPKLSAPVTSYYGGAANQIRVTLPPAMTLDAPLPSITFASLSIHYTNNGREPNRNDPAIPPTGSLPLRYVGESFRMKAFATAYEASDVAFSSVGQMIPPGPLPPVVAPPPEGRLVWCSSNSAGLNRSTVINQPGPTYSDLTGIDPCPKWPLYWTNVPVFGPTAPYTCFLLSRKRAPMGSLSLVVENTAIAFGAGGDEWTLQEIAFDGQRLISGINGILTGGAIRAGGGSVSAPQLRIVGNDAQACELILYNRILDYRERKQILDYIVTKHSYRLAWNLADSDSDGVPDWKEAELGTSSNSSDSDGDLLSDYEEVFVFFTNPASFDSDGDHIGDAQEVEWGLNPNSGTTTPGTPDTQRDIDGDGFSDVQEIAVGSEANNPNSHPIPAGSGGGGPPDPKKPETIDFTIVLEDPNHDDDRWGLYMQTADFDGNYGPRNYVLHNDDREENPEPTYTRQITWKVPVGKKLKFTIEREKADQHAGTDEFQITITPPATMPKGVIWLPNPTNPALDQILQYGSQGELPVTKGIAWEYFLFPVELESMDRFLAGSIDQKVIAALGGESQLGLIFRHSESAESYSYSKLADTHLYDNPYSGGAEGQDAFLSDAEVLLGLGEKQIKQDVVFYRDGGRLHFRALFDETGKIEIGVLIGEVECGKTEWTLTRDYDIAPLIETIDQILSGQYDNPQGPSQLLMFSLAAQGATVQSVSFFDGFQARGLTLKVMMPAWTHIKSAFKDGVRLATEAADTLVKTAALGGQGFVEGAWAGIKGDAQSVADFARALANPIETGKSFYEGFKALLGLSFADLKNIPAAMINQFLDQAEQNIVWAEPDSKDVAIYVVSYSAGYLGEQVVMGVVGGAFKGVIAGANIGSKIAAMLSKIKAGQRVLDGAQKTYASVQTVRNAAMRRLSSFAGSPDSMKRLKGMIEETLGGVGCPSAAE